jgi:hypothetical protein
VIGFGLSGTQVYLPLPGVPLFKCQPTGQGMTIAPVPTGPTFCICEFAFASGVLSTDMATEVRPTTKIKDTTITANDLKSFIFPPLKLYSLLVLKTLSEFLISYPATPPPPHVKFYLLIVVYLT